MNAPNQNLEPSAKKEPEKTSFAKLSFLSYLPAILKGLGNTFLHMIKAGRHKTFTLGYPEKRLPVRKGYRGEHRLKRDETGREKCVACFMCQAVCPAHCIRIIAEEAPWSDRDKRPQVFEIESPNPEVGRVRCSRSPQRLSD